MRSSSLLLPFVLIAMSLPGAARQAPQKLPAGGTVTISQPGRAGITNVKLYTAQVVSIDRASRTLGLEQANGTTQRFTVGDAVRNFDRIQVGDKVQARFIESVTLEVKKTGSTETRQYEREAEVHAKAGDQPGAMAGHQLVILANLVALDPEAMTMTLQGPEGSLVLPVRNPDHFKVARVGDQVEVVYTEALVVDLEQAPAPAK
jgi:hypothetical protein